MDKQKKISKELFKTILQDSKVTTPDVLKIFQTISNSFGLRSANSTDVANQLGINDKVIVHEIINRYGNKVSEIYGIERKLAKNGIYINWKLFFQGYKTDNFFYWKLKRELQQALEELSLTTSPSQIKKAWLFTFNSDPKNWKDLEESFDYFNLYGNCLLTWRCKSISVKEGDIAFLVKTGKNPEGIIGSGIVTTTPILHTNENNQTSSYIQIPFTTLLDWRENNILTIADLKKNEHLAKQNWTPQASGIPIRPELIKELETTWSNFLTNQKIQHTPFVLSNSETPSTFTEGTAVEVILTIYERDRNARIECIKHYGYFCTVCNFDFEKHYGEIGKNFIHVHHLTEISSIAKSYEIDPVKDLRPVCPNCHAMIHRRKPALSIEELIKKMQ